MDRMIEGQGLEFLFCYCIGIGWRRPFSTYLKGVFEPWAVSTIVAGFVLR